MFFVCPCGEWEGGTLYGGAVGNIPPSHFPGCDFISQPQPQVGKLIVDFYPTALMGCRGIVFTHGVRAGGRKKFVRAVSQKP